MKALNSLKLFGVGVISVVTLQGCTDDARHSAPLAPTEEVIVQPSDIRLCNLPRDAYRCHLNAQASGGTDRFSMSVEVAGRSRWSPKVIYHQRKSYFVDGNVHYDVDRRGIETTYNVTCAQDSFVVNVKSPNSLHSMRLSLQGLRTLNPTIQFLSVGNNGRTLGTGTCYRYRR